MLNLFAHVVEALIQKRQVRHPRRWNPVRMFDDMDINLLNAMVSISSWIWGNPYATDTGRPRAACGPGGGGGGAPPPAANLPLQWGQFNRMPLHLRNIAPINERITQARSSTTTALSQVLHMISASEKIEPPKKRQKTRSHEVRQRWVEHVSGWDSEDIRNVIMQTAKRALIVKSIF